MNCKYEQVANMQIVWKYREGHMTDIILDSVIDSVKLLPFLFLTYLFMEWLEHKTGSAARNRIRTAGKLGPVWGGLLGMIPQCGFSAAASSLFTGRVITVGTLIAVYLSTSDEMFPRSWHVKLPSEYYQDLLWSMCIRIF